MNLVLMASGTGTNAINLIKHSKQYKNINIVGVVVDKKDSPLILNCENIPVFLIQKYKNETVESHENRILEKLNSLDCHFIFLCGYMRILSSNFINNFKNRILNIHPSLLPEFKGAHAYEDAFDARVPFSGITIHFVTAELDSGEILFQEKFERLPNDTFSDFVKRGKEVEWNIYPKALNWLEIL